MPSDTVETTGARSAAPRVAVLVPCYNEELTVGQVVAELRAALPDAAIYVYDNDSSDATAERAAEAGAVVRRERRRGKGNVVRRMFAEVDADVYVMIDGDGTYPADAAPAMLASLAEEQLDMVVAARAQEDHRTASRSGHGFGNAVLTRTISLIFGQMFTDVLSGYRAFSRRFVKSFPALSRGFEIETEMTVHALQLGLPVAEIATRYLARPEGSSSKLNTWRDGWRILMTILLLFKEVRPFVFFGSVFAVLALMSLGLALPVFATYLETGLVPRLPTAVLATGMMLLGFLSLGCGIILDSVSRARLEQKRMHYLSVRAAREPGDDG